MTDSPFQPPPFSEAEFVEDDDELEDEDEDELDEADEADEEIAAVRPAPVSSANAVDGGAARAVLEHVARSIVDEPDAVLVEVGSGRSGVRLSLHVAPGDMGRIIGKRGRVAQAVRTVVRAAAAREGTDASVDIVD